MDVQVLGCLGRVAAVLALMKTALREIDAGPRQRVTFDIATTGLDTPVR